MWADFCFLPRPSSTVCLAVQDRSIKKSGAVQACSQSTFYDWSNSARGGWYKFHVDRFLQIHPAATAEVDPRSQTTPSPENGVAGQFLTTQPCAEAGGCEGYLFVGSWKAHVSRKTACEAELIGWSRELQV